MHYNLQLEDKLFYRFSDPNLLKIALTHPSVLPEMEYYDFERYEFVGDRVLNLILLEWLYGKFPHCNKKYINTIYMHLISGEICYWVAQTVGLKDIGIYSQDYKKPRRITADKYEFEILKDMIEAIIAAMFFDGGIDACKEFIRHHWNLYVNSSDFRYYLDHEDFRGQAAPRKVPIKFKRNLFIEIMDWGFAQKLPVLQHRVLDPQTMTKKRKRVSNKRLQKSTTKAILMILNKISPLQAQIPQRNTIYRSELYINDTYRMIGTGTTQKNAALDAAQKFVARFMNSNPKDV